MSIYKLHSPKGLEDALEILVTQKQNSTGDILGSIDRYLQTQAAELVFRKSVILNSLDTTFLVSDAEIRQIPCSWPHALFTHFTFLSDTTRMQTLQRDLAFVGLIGAFVVWRCCCKPEFNQKISPQYSSFVYQNRSVPDITDLRNPYWRHRLIQYWNYELN